MKIQTVLSTFAVLGAVAFSGSAFAQEEHMIGGKAVSADQVTEVQAKCDELRKAAPAAATEAPADSSMLWSADGKLDVTKLTVAECDEGKFAATAQ